MPNWLAKATGAVSRQEEDEPQTFQLTCECKEQHSGQRKTRPQRIICQTCGAALFVLPKNVYPPPQVRQPRKRKRKTRSANGPPTGPGLPTAHEMATAARQSMTSVAGGVGRGILTAGGAVRHKATSTVAAFFGSIRAFFSPFRIVLTGIVIMFLTTAYLAIQSHVRELARTRFREELEAGQSALAEDDLQDARLHFDAAVDAVDTLGTSDPMSNLVRQLHRETTAMTSLAPSSLFAMLEEGERVQAKTGAVRWENVFRSRYQESWFVLQATIRRTESWYELDFPFRIGEEQRQITVRVEFPDLQRLSFEEGTADVVFAAPILGCELNDTKQRWIITLGGEDGFLWSDAENLRRLGFFEPEWVDEDGIVSTLSAQTERLGRMP